MALARLDGSAIVDWDAFHEVCAEVFGFPAFYGRNMNAWMDCLTYINEGDGMSRFVLKPDELLRVEVTDSGVLRERQPDIFAALVDCTAAVNARLGEAGDRPRLELAFL